MPAPRANVADWILSGGKSAAPAIWHGQQMLTHGELRRRAWAIAAQLLSAGLAGGNRVGLFAENSPFFVAAYLGSIGAGLCVVPFQTDAPDKTLQRLIASLGIKHVLVSARFHSRVRPLADNLGLTLLLESAEPSLPSGDPGAPPRVPQVDPARYLAAVMLTSGSTGEAKGVMVTHRNIACNTQDILQYAGIAADDRAMVVLPFSYCYGASLLHTVLAAGGSLVLNNRFMFPETVLDEMVQKHCTGLAGVPSTYQILLRKTRFAQRSFPALRWMQQAGGKLPDPLLRELRQAFPAVRLLVMYGQTEGTARLSYLPPERLDDKLGSIGKGLPGTRLEVLKPDGAPVRPGSDEVGEIVASGDNVTPGYWGDPEETARFFRDGKLYTGDMARVDAEGFIFIVERARDFIKAAGNRVSPKEVEDVLAEMPEVVEAAVIGVPHEIWGEAIKAYVVAARPGQLTADEVRRHCMRQLPNYKVPEYVEFLPALPKTSNGKVAKEQLK
jgi:acyl-CoA synthetase (AMP-forming)/AMP-acid ligase II